ncbi:MAG: hypothetical protein ACK55K_02005 [Bacteroidota bacterium]|jgi:hypothetical protein
MHIRIHDQISLKEIQDLFSVYYPHLRLRFYKKPHKHFDDSPESERLSEDSLLSEILKTHIDGLLEIMPNQRVDAVEDMFLKRFGLSVQILKKEKGNWVQTTGLDSYSLKEVNQFSKNDDDAYVVKDYDEGFEGGVF